MPRTKAILVPNILWSLRVNGKKIRGYSRLAAIQTATQWKIKYPASVVEIVGEVLEVGQS